MIHDLEGHHDAAGALPCDVAIVGAGVAGTIMACELARRGFDTILLESGGTTQVPDVHPLNRVIQTGDIYHGAERGRFRCLGGTSTRWGGALLPFLAEDLLASAPSGLTEPWPVDLEDLLRHLPEAERLFSLPPGPYELPTDVPLPADATFRARAAKWPAFRRRNIARVLGSELRSATGPRVWLNANVTRLRLGEDGRVTALEAAGASGSHLVVSPKIAVVAAGAIESTRLLLKMDADHGEQPFGWRSVAGCYFHDHLSAPVASLRVRERKKLDRLVGFRFQGPGMRNLRFELSGHERLRRGLPGAFVHVGFKTDQRNGFDALREIYRSTQRGQMPAGADLAQMASDSGWLVRAAWTRWTEHRVLPPDQARYEVHVVTEQTPVPTNRITLSDQCDAYGVPLAQIHWRVSDGDVRNMTDVRNAFAEYWSGSALERLADIEVGSPDSLEETLSSGGGIYHPGGSLRMSATPRTGVVDGDLRTFAVPNLRVVSTAAFPSGGTANPTMMLILFALRASADIARELRARH